MLGPGTDGLKDIAPGERSELVFDSSLRGPEVAVMGSLRLQFPLWVLLLGVMVSALLIDGAIQSCRQAARSGCQARAIYHGQRQQDHLGCIPEDLGVALACARRAAEGAPIPRVMVFIQPSTSSHCARESKLGHQDSGLVSLWSDWPMDAAEGPRGALTIYWIKESVWWIAEAARDWRRAAWHGGMRRKWEQAASSSPTSASPDPAEP
jgi:hypothetical protein